MRECMCHFSVSTKTFVGRCCCVTFFSLVQWKFRVSGNEIENNNKIIKTEATQHEPLTNSLFSLWVFVFCDASRSRLYFELAIIWRRQCECACAYVSHLNSAVLSSLACVRAIFFSRSERIAIPLDLCFFFFSYSRQTWFQRKVQIIVCNLTTSRLNNVLNQGSRSQWYSVMIDYVTDS